MNKITAKLSPLQKDALRIIANKWLPVEEELKHKTIYVKPITIHSLINRGYIEFKESDFHIKQYTVTKSGYFLTQKGIELFRKGII